MTHPIHRPSIFNRLLPLVSLSLFAAAMWALHDALRQFRYHHILTQLQNVSASHVLAAVGLTVLSYLVMTGYDQLAITYIRHPLNVVKVTLASFISYAFSNTIGLSLLTSGSIRYRLYSAWGLSAEEIARLVVFTTVTFWSGIVAVAGMLFIVEPMAMPIPLQTVNLPARLVGLFCVVLVITVSDHRFLAEKAIPLSQLGTHDPFATSGRGSVVGRIARLDPGWRRTLRPAARAGHTLVCSIS